MRVLLSSLPFSDWSASLQQATRSANQNLARTGSSTARSTVYDRYSYAFHHKPHSAFSPSLPSFLSFPFDNFLAKAKGNEVVAETIREFFVNEGMERTFGLAMLHRHFDLEANERLVDYQGTSTPWQATVPGMRDPQAAIWAFDKDDVLRPTEFRYSETVDAPLPENAPDFIRKFNAFLKQLNMVNVLGLASYPGDDFQGSCEITHGRANINLKPEDYPANLQHIPTIWFFSEPLWTRGCRCTCNASDPDHPHGYHVITRSG